MLCKHIHYMMITNYLMDGSFEYHHNQCAEQKCECQVGVYDNLKYLEYLNEQKEKED